MKLDSFNDLVESFNSLPSVGKKSATRFAYHLLLKDNFLALRLSHSIENALKKIQKCHICNFISEDEICEICDDSSRDAHILSIVLHPKDIFTLEENANYVGKYFILESIEEETIDKLKVLIDSNNISEIIFAFSPSIANEGLILHVEDQLKNYNIHFTKLARGIPTGVDLENIDMISISKAMELRVKI